MAGLPIKTTADDIDKLTGYLRNQVGWVTTQKIGAATSSKLIDGRKLEAMKYIGLIERDGASVKLTDADREFASASSEAIKQGVIAARLKSVPLYESTLEWIHHNDREAPTKTDIANYWHDNHAQAIGGAHGDALTDAVVFFLRMADLAGLAKFVPAGNRRDSHIKVNAGALTEFATGVPPTPEVSMPDAQEVQTKTERKPLPPPPPVTVSDRIQLNIEIHIAADTKPATVEQIFKNMKTYLLDKQQPPNN